MVYRQINGDDDDWPNNDNDMLDLYIYIDIFWFFVFFLFVCIWMNVKLTGRLAEIRRLILRQNDPFLCNQVIVLISSERRQNKIIDSINKRLRMHLIDSNDLQCIVFIESVSFSIQTNNTAQTNDTILNDKYEIWIEFPIDKLEHLNYPESSILMMLSLNKYSNCPYRCYLYGTKKPVWHKIAQIHIVSRYKFHCN